jgi:hypothetical protein
MAKKAATQSHTVVQDSAVDPGVILQLDPSAILADDNTRFNLKESRIQTLAESIVAQGGVIEPVEVEPIEGNNGFSHRLTVGFYRHAAVKYLNTTQAAGLTLPALVHINANPTVRLQRQLAENIERENQSPMDSAIAIKRLMEAGLSRIEVRQMFSRPSSRKGAKGKPEPASNAWVNMMLSFLELPKPAQDKIHMGVVGVAAAYQLTKVPKEKQTEILARAEDARQRELEQEEKEEERFLTTEKKQKEQTEKVTTAKAALEAAETKNKAAAETLDKQTHLTAELFKSAKGRHNTPKDKKAADVAFKDAEKARLAAENVATEAQKEYEKAQVAFSRLTEQKEVKAKKVVEEKAKKAAVKPGDVTKAAKAAGAATGAVLLNASEMRKTVMEMGLPTGSKGDEEMKALSSALVQCFAGITTPESLYREVRKMLV